MDMDKMILKFVWKVRGAKILTKILRREKKGGASVLAIKTSFAVCVGAAGCFPAGGRPWNAIGNSEANRHLWDQLIFGKGGKSISAGRLPFQQIELEQLEIQRQKQRSN